MLCNSMIQQKKVTDSGLQFFLMVIIFLIRSTFIYIKLLSEECPLSQFKRNELYGNSFQKLVCH